MGTGNSSVHRWTFSRSGGFDQARLDSAADFANLEQLDQKLWAALACPVKGLEFDERTLSLIDTDNDGRVRAPEVIAAVQWCEDNLRDLAALKNGADTLPLAQINDRTESGKAILASAKQILKDLGKADAAAITLADAADTTKIFAQTRFNGDGIVPADAADDDATRKVVEDVIACMGAETDRSGKPGVNQAKADAFFGQCAAFDEWVAKSESDSAVRCLGEGTAAALDAVKAVRAKVDDYFARCRMAAYDQRALVAVNRQQDEYLAIAAKDLSITVTEISGFPLSRIEAGRPLSLTSGLNPAWEGAAAALRAAAVAPMLGKDRTTLTAEEWAALNAKLAGYEAWLGTKPVTAVEKLGIARIREILKCGAKDAITALIAQDKALEKEALSIAHVDRLVRYYRDLNRLLCNFVNFSDFYSKDRHAIFQVGTLYLDARACELCVRVDDPGKHAALAGFAKAYLAYCDCTRPTGEKMTIAAAFTGGDSDFLMPGRNGIFYDRKGRDWDATITKVIENPISIRQAFWSPYKKLVRMIEEHVAKRAAAAEAESDARVAAASATVAHVDKAAASAAAEKRASEPKKLDVGAVAAMGVAVGAIGTAMAYMFGNLVGLFSLPFWEICLAVGGIFVLISTPSMLIAWLKLRQRNLGPILDANGWAVNGRVKMNVKFGGSLTSVAQLPLGSLPAEADPFGERRSRWPGVLKFVVIVGFLYSFLNWYAWIYTGLELAGVKSERVLGYFTSPADIRKREQKAEADAAAKEKQDAEKRAAAETK